MKSWLWKLRPFGCVFAALALVGCVGPSNTPGPAAPISGTWTQLGGDGSHASWGADLPTPPLQELWYTSRAGGFEFAPIVVGGRIIIASRSCTMLSRTTSTPSGFRHRAGSAGGKTLETHDVLVAHIENGKFREIWFHSDDSQSGDEFWS